MTRNKISGWSEYSHGTYRWGRIGFLGEWILRHAETKIHEIRFLKDRKILF